MYTRGGTNATPLYVAPPTFYSHAHIDFSTIFSGFLHRSIEIWPSGVPKVQGLCGRGLVGVTFVGMALASKASINNFLNYLSS